MQVLVGIKLERLTEQSGSNSHALSPNNTVFVPLCEIEIMVFYIVLTGLWQGWLLLFSIDILSLTGQINHSKN